MGHGNRTVWIVVVVIVVVALLCCCVVVVGAAGPVALDIGAGDIDYAGDPQGDCTFENGAGSITGQQQEPLAPAR